MIKVKLEGFEANKARLMGQGGQVKFAAAVALTRTAKLGQAAVVDEMKRVFDRPTPMTLKALWVKTAKKTDLTAMVYVKDRPLGGKNPNSMAQILRHQFSGGARMAKQLEVLLRQQGFLQGNEFVVPGGGATLDAFGNMSRGQVVQILSQIGIRRAGFDSSPTNSRRSKKHVAAAGQMFWSFGPKGGASGSALVDKTTGITYGHTGRSGAATHLAKGVWVRRGRGVAPLLLVVKGAPHYRQRIDLPKIVGAVVDAKFDSEFQLALSNAMRTAR